MGRTFIGVRDVDEETFRKFKEMSVGDRMKLGIALTLAMKRLLKEHKKKRHKKLMGPRLEPFNWGHGTEKTSEEIDKILYGWKK